MNFIKKVIALIKVLLLVTWLLGMLIIGAMIFRQNQQIVHVQLFAWEVEGVATGVLISASLLVGVILGLLAVIPVWWFERIRSRRLATRLKVSSALEKSSLSLGYDG